MIVQMNKQGVVTLTAENAEENIKLFEVANEANFKAKANYATDVDRPKRKYTKRATYLKNCPVEGCDHKARGIDMHLRNAHGIHPDGTLHNTFTYNGGRGKAGKVAPQERPVKMPVVKTDNGYRLKNPSQGSGLLGHTESFSRSRIIN